MTQTHELIAESSSYRTLQSWYLARLRAEAVELSERSRMTPLARIDTDRQALLVRSGKTQSITPSRRAFPGKGVLGIWALINLALLAILVMTGASGAVLIIFCASFACGLLLGGIFLAHERHSERANVRYLWQRLKDIGATIAETDEPPDSNTIELLDQAVVDLSLRERIIADYAKEFLFAFDEKLRVDSCNMASVRLLGYIPDQLAGKSLADISVVTKPAELEQKVAKGKNGKEFRFELTAVAKNGSLLDLEVIAEWSNRQQLFFAVAHDITATKAVQRARSEFVSMISHDVRAPLQGVLFAIDTLVQTITEVPGERALTSLARMERNVQLVIDLIGELIDFERSSDTALTLKRSEFDLHEMIDHIIDQVRDVATYRSISLVNEAETIRVNADRPRIARVVLNLVANALKFSPPNSSITITTKKSASSVEVRISDQGPGIPKHLIGAIFERYFQIQTADGELTDSKIPGSGLGLAICKAFVEAHAGLIGVESKEAQGSTFWFTLPI
jgi:PAS domain S-box-containing protein